MLGAEAGDKAYLKAIAKCPDFLGQDGDWPNWKFRFESWFVLAVAAQVDDAMRMLVEAALAVGPMDESALRPEAQAASKLLYASLVNLCRGKALTIARRSPRGQGFELWRQLVQEYESAVGARTTAMLVGLLTPSWDSSRPFLEVLGEWELAIDEYESQAGDAISPTIRCAVVFKHCPPEIRRGLQTHIAGINGDWPRMRGIIRAMLVDIAAYDGSGAKAGEGEGPVPMQVDAAQSGKPWGKTKGKGKEKG